MELPGLRLSTLANLRCQLQYNSAHRTGTGPRQAYCLLLAEFLFNTCSLSDTMIRSTQQLCTPLRAGWLSKQPAATRAGGFLVRLALGGGGREQWIVAEKEARAWHPEPGNLVTSAGSVSPLLLSLNPSLLAPLMPRCIKYKSKPARHRLGWNCLS